MVWEEWEEWEEWAEWECNSVKSMNLKKAAILQPFFLKITHTLEILKSNHLSITLDKGKGMYQKLLKDMSSSFKGC